MGKKYQIFVSSTYDDLEHERQIAIDTIIKLGQIPAGMELFSATGENQFEMIKPIIFESDYYLLIVAGKYGTICEETGISYTEMEYDFAVQNNKRIIAFVYDTPDELPVKAREITDKMREKLNKFRKKVMTNRMVKIWHSKEELFQSIPISISTVIEKYPSNTCWVHVEKDDVYKPIEKYLDLQKYLPIEIGDNIHLYFNNLKKETLKIQKKAETLQTDIDIPQKKLDSDTDEFAGVSIGIPLDIRNWTEYILNGYSLLIDYFLKADTQIDVWVEVKGAAVEMCKQLVTLEVGKEKQILILLNEFLEDLDDWKKVKEICLVFRPEKNNMVGLLEISGIRLER